MDAAQHAGRLKRKSSHESARRLTIVSGGQTGVDRGALDAALAQGAPCRGWCPAGRRAEDGTIPARYPVTSLPERAYATRTRRNVQDSDATVVIHRGPLAGGSLLTAREARHAGRPMLRLDAEHLDARASARQLRDFVLKHRPRALNVAGPRASEWPGGRRRAFAVVRRLLQSLARDD